MALSRLIPPSSSLSSPHPAPHACVIPSPNHRIPHLPQTGRYFQITNHIRPSPLLMFRSRCTRRSNKPPFPIIQWPTTHPTRRPDRHRPRRRLYRSAILSRRPLRCASPSRHSVLPPAACRRQPSPPTPGRRPRTVWRTARSALRHRRHQHPRLCRERTFWRTWWQCGWSAAAGEPASHPPTLSAPTTPSSPTTWTLPPKTP